MQFLAPTLKYKVLKLAKGGTYFFSETLGGPYGFAERRTTCFEGLCNGFFKTYALIPC
jgi:hypothetical protein